MNDIIFEILKLVVMLAVLVITKYVIPFIKTRINNAQLETIAKWAKYAVLKAQQVMATQSNAKKKAYVMAFLKEMLQECDLELTDDQLDILIEAAVKEMKIAEA